MDFSSAIRELLVGDSKIFYYSYIIIGIFVGIALSGILLEFFYLKKIKKYKAFGVFEIIVRILFITLAVSISLESFKIDSEEVVKTTVGKYYLDQTKEIEEMKLKEIEKSIDSQYVETIVESGIYDGLKEVPTDKAYYEVEKWEIQGRMFSPIYVIIEKGVLNQ